VVHSPHQCILTHFNNCNFTKAQMVCSLMMVFHTETRRSFLMSIWCKFNIGFKTIQLCISWWKKLWQLKFISLFSNTYLWKWLVTPRFCQCTSITLLWATVYIRFVFWKVLISCDVNFCYSMPPPLLPLKLTLFSFTLFCNLHFNLQYHFFIYV
jgi:hypothetical protein